MTKKTKPATFLIPKSLGAEEIWVRVSSRYAIERKGYVTARRRYYDTFDWRLYRAGLVLMREDDRYELRRLADDVVVAEADLAGRKRFWWEFPDGSLKDELRRCLEQRALIALVSARIERRTADVRDAHGKTIARIALGHAIANGAPTVEPMRAVTLQPRPGYDGEYRRLRQEFVDQGLLDRGLPWFFLLLEHGGRTPCDYSSRLHVALHPEMWARDAAVAIFRRLVDTIERNEHGVCNDIDTEFLHDFRVAVRRTRAALSQIKDVFPPDAAQRFKADFSKLGKLTNRLRDLDVYLLKREAYAAMLPEQLRPALQPLFDELARERMRELDHVVEAIRGGDYRARINDWREFLDHVIAEPATVNSLVPIGALARRLIEKRYKRMIRMGRAIDDSSPDEDLHKLRIEGKKLRYLLEFFSSLFPADDIALLIKQLKRLQDNLGDYNDLSIQQDDLRRTLDRPGVTTDTAAAIGGLITELRRRVQVERARFGKEFGHFASRRNAAVYRRLFHSG